MLPAIKAQIPLKVYLGLLGVGLVSACFKAWLVVSQVVPFNADEAIVALMACHILHGEIPLFFYGQAYMGSLDAALVAVFFSIFGEQVWVIRLVQGVLYLGTIYTTFWLGVIGLGSIKTGLLAAVFMAIPTVNGSLYTTASLGGYGEALLIGNLILLVGYSIARRFHSLLENADHRSRLYKWQIIVLLSALWGGLVGLGLWANSLTLVYTLPIGIYLAWCSRKILKQEKLRWLLILLGIMLTTFLLFSLPWWIFALNHGPGALINELTGSAVAVESGWWMSRVVNHLVNFLLLGIPVILSFRPPWDVTWLMLPFIPFVLFFWGWVAVSWLIEFRKRQASGIFNLILVGVMITILLGFLFTSFGVDPSGRYFLPFIVVLSLLAADQIVRWVNIKRIWKIIVIILVVIFQLGGNIQSYLRNPPGFTTQFDAETIIDHSYDNQLIAFLRNNGVSRGYTNYWVAYPLAFLSGEELIFIPRLSYHSDLRYTPRDDRYPPYRDAVAASEKVAFITTHQPSLDAYLRDGFYKKEIYWEEQQIGDYRIFYGLSAKITPEELGLVEGNR